MKRGPSLAAAVVAVALAGAVPAEAGKPGDRARTLKLRATTVSAKLVDNAPVGEVGPGDQVLLSENISRRGRKVGHTVVACAIVTEALESQCSFTLTLKTGSLQYAGMGTTRRTERFAVVGGTGAYTGARGEVITRERGTNQHDLTFALR